MFVRIPLLLALLLSLALGPVQLSAACILPVTVASTGGAAESCVSCCTDPAEVCCVSAAKNVPAKAPDTVAPQSVDGKLLVTPTVVVVGLSPLPVVERPAISKRYAAQRPAVSRLAVTCIRLI